jgi:hypothetical protein
VVLDVAGDLARVRDAERDARVHPQVEAGLDECGVARERHARDRETHAGVDEGKLRRRRHVLERVLPSNCGARHHHHPVLQRHDRGSADAERGIADALALPWTCERAIPPTRGR